MKAVVARSVFGVCSMLLSVAVLYTGGGHSGGFVRSFAFVHDDSF